MKKRMRLWQLTLGYVICVGIIFSMFLSRITISSDRIIDCVTDIMDDMSEIYDEQKGAEDSDWADLLGKSFDEDNRENLKRNVEKNFGDKKITCSSAQIMFASKHGVEKYVQEITGAEELGKDEKVVIAKFHEALFWPRVMLFAIYFLPIVLIVLYYLTYWKKWRNFFAIISTWVYVILAAVSNILWFFFLPGKGAEKITDTLGDSLGNVTGEFTFSLMEGAVEDLLSPMLRHAFTSFTGSGIWVFLIGSVLLFIYSLLLLLLRDTSFAGQEDSWVGTETEYAGNEEAGEEFFPEELAGSLHQDSPMIEDIIQQRNSDRMAYAGGERHPVNREMKLSAEEARIYIAKGSLAGAEISCTPGEQIVVGRDSDVSDLVLSHPKISRKHFVLQYVEDKDCYQIFCFSKNGIYLSTGGKIGMSQSGDIARGTMLIMADGEEEMVLG